ncbi:TetR family transcriptional regulator C-terminal domain-containing protein [Pseudonocardia sp. S2-4]|uniref:TetR family transcriptional regulator C-terminal domain-containing protein n=2 Tax=Pseudonocardia humida TaxID=2800819 RepID=A0ABT1ABV8_9PSEU|nr:TetR family transcriptional regulator C-terminal domain-containing protein [Pseudonocardia humida]
MHGAGVAGTTMDQVVDASHTSKSQLYHYFADKEALVAAVIKFQVARVLEFQEPYLERLASVADLRRWRDAVVWFVEEARGVNGCAVGSLSSELADRSELARILIQAAFRSWESYLAAELRWMQDRSELDAGADPSELATGLMAAYQGGYLLSQAARSSRPMAMALDLALDSIEGRRVRGDRASERRADAVQARTAVTYSDLTVQ